MHCVRFVRFVCVFVCLCVVLCLCGVHVIYCVTMYGVCRCCLRLRVCVCESVFVCCIGGLLCDVDWYVVCVGLCLCVFVRDRRCDVVWFGCVIGIVLV